MKEVKFPIGNDQEKLLLPDDCDILRMPHPPTMNHPSEVVKESLNNPISSITLEEIVKNKISEGNKAEDLTACIVISDSTRPVPYTGDQGILWPVVEKLLSVGIVPENILVLVATGTHRGQTDQELKKMLDHRIFEIGVVIRNHDCHNKSNLSHLGKTTRGSEIMINSDYVNSDVKILTGLVESHFMAGASGGRKSICPGLIGEESTFIFHGAPMLANENAKALLLEGNPCHDESLEMALCAGADFIVNVTLDGNFNLTGVFSGHLEHAHKAAVEHLKSYTAIKVDKKYDIVVTHAGFVGINHYQAAKAGVEASRIVKEGGYVLIGADNSDSDPIGSLAYRTALQILKLSGREAFEKLILTPDWPFLIEQWQVQMWNRLFKLIPQEHLYYFSPQFTNAEYRICPGQSMMKLSESESLSLPVQINKSLRALVEKIRKETGTVDISICWMVDGPYGVPLLDE